MLLRSFVKQAESYRSGEDAPTRLLHQSMERLAALNDDLKAFVCTAPEQARSDAAQSDVRWLTGQPRSPIDGMIIGIKDIIETYDMPTGQGSPLWSGFQTHRDSATVQALREAGAIILGKTTTTEFASSEPIFPSRNPHDISRTAGGSSSGSAAAVGAGIVPVAIGTQVVGSTLRPASYCGCFGFKPTFGALNRGGSYDHLSHSCTGILGGSLDDVWAVAMVISERVGGDPGHRALTGPSDTPLPRKPVRLARLETAGWAAASPGARQAYEAALDRLKAAGVEIVTRGDDPDLDAFEALIAEAHPLTLKIIGWENRWPMGTYAERAAEQLSEMARSRLEQVETMTTADYHEALDRRDAIRARYAALAARFDGLIALAATGAAPLGLEWTGDPKMNVPASLLGIPALSLPCLTDNGMPLGLQLLGRSGKDADLFEVAGWVWSHLEPAA
jgi:Asp-tRNA(Asn)/Glu-tRNA(Gln) amidotransferase A subunit family amidase